MSCSVGLLDFLSVRFFKDLPLVPSDFSSSLHLPLGVCRHFVLFLASTFPQISDMHSHCGGVCILRTFLFSFQYVYVFTCVRHTKALQLFSADKPVFAVSPADPSPSFQCFHGIQPRLCLLVCLHCTPKRLPMRTLQLSTLLYFTA